MLPRSKRLTSSQVKTVFAKGRKFFSPLFTFLFVKNHNNETKLAVIVPKKVSKKKVERSRLKRRLSATVEELLPLFPTVWGVYIIKKEMRDATPEELKKEVRKQLSKTQPK